MEALSLPSDLVTPERLIHDQIEAVETVKAGQKAGRVVDYLDHLLKRQWIERGLYDLAREYGELRWDAGLVPRAQAGALAADRVDGGGGHLLPGERRAKALQRLLETDAAVIRQSGRRRAAERHISVLAAVCGDGRSANEWAWSEGHRAHGQGLAILKDALRILRRVWGR